VISFLSISCFDEYFKKIEYLADVLESSSDKTTSISSTISTGTTFNRDSASTEVSPETTPKTKETKGAKEIYQSKFQRLLNAI
jgi:hypothetical protein